MPHSNISIFVPHVGCPHMCSFCNQQTITGVQNIPHDKDVKRICSEAMNDIEDYSNTEIAFFGGSFTAVPRDYMIELLKASHEFLGQGKFKGIRISTRPDCINEEILEILKQYGVTAIELGAQSMCNHVLQANDRGHTAEDICNASQLIKAYEFELGLQMMTGLYMSSKSDDIYTMNEIIKLAPHTVRIYPVAVLENTKLAELYRSGSYKLISFDEMTDLCSYMLSCFYMAGIRVIRCGLHASETVERDIVAGFYHPAFREICESEVCKTAVLKHIKFGEAAVVYVSEADVSRAVGHKKKNKHFFDENNYEVEFKVDLSLEKGEICINKDVYNVFEIT